MNLSSLNPGLQRYIKDNRWKDLSDIQKAAFDPIFNCEHCIIEAPTSGGKTEAVFFPLLTRVSQKKRNGIKILYIAPLKALLNNVSKRIEKLSKNCSLTSFKWHGDVSQGDKIEQMTWPSDILLTTPESIEAILLRKGNWQTVFGNLESIIIDEAHYFASTERGIHLMSLLERIKAGIQSNPQRIAISATIGNRDVMMKWLVGNEREGRCIKVLPKVGKEKDFRVYFYESDSLDMYNDLYKLLIRKKSIVFENSRTSTENTATKLNERNKLLQSKFPLMVRTHHSSISKRFREEAERSIANTSLESLNAIVSTSTLELGIDIGELDQIIQMGGLNSSSSFLQRVGRTGRRDGKPQFFRGYCIDPEELLLLIGCVNLGLHNKPESILFPSRSFHILAHQIICLCLQAFGTCFNEIWNTLMKSYNFSNISKEELAILIDYMIEEGYLRRTDDNTLMTGEQTETKFLSANWRRLFAIFDTGAMYNVVDGRKLIGTLDFGFASSQKLPFIFVLGGQEWRATKIDHEAQQIVVKKNTTGLPPKWKTLTSGDVPFEMAQEIGRILMLKNFEASFLDQSAVNIFKSIQGQYEDMNWTSGKWQLDYSLDQGILYIWTFSGDKINRCIFSYLCSNSNLSGNYDYKMIKLDAENTTIDIEKVEQKLNTLKSLAADELQDLLVKDISVKWFSKFSECLPDHLAKISILEKSMDIEGTLREARSSNIVVV